MKNLGVLLAIAAAFIGGPCVAQQKHIPKAQLEEMFANIKSQTSWNIGGNMLWGYFFTGTDKSELKKIAAQLVNDGYRLVDIRKRDSAAPNWQLHVEKVETHSVDTLDDRDTQFEALASQAGNVIYDGMDVGPAN